MITTIQTSAAYLENLNGIITEYNAIVYNNENRDNSFLRFKDMLDIDFDDYRFHLQDNVILADNLKQYIDTILIEFMNKNNINLLSLSSHPLKSITTEYFLGRRIADNSRRTFFHLNNIGVIYSKNFINSIKQHIIHIDQEVDDIVFLNKIFKTTYFARHVHLPILVQSALHPINNLFDKNFLKK
jgi:hypothetical protein